MANLSKYPARVKYINPDSTTALMAMDALEKLRKTYRFRRMPSVNSSYDRLINHLRDYFPDLTYLGQGIARNVWKLNHKTVFKVADNHNSNRTELINCQNNPELTTKVYLHYVDTNLDILVSEKCRAIYQKMPLFYQEKYKDQYQLLKDNFHDMHGNNVGLVGRRLVALDVGEEYSS